MRILMVCLGNICRSPIAEGVLRTLIQADRLGWEVDSCGTNSYHIGSCPHEYSQKICQSNNIDISQQVARRFVAEDFSRFDKIFVMAEDVMNDLRELAGPAFDGTKVDYFLNELYPQSNRSVPDPWYGPEAGYTEVFDLIEKTCHKIIERYK